MIITIRLQETIACVRGGQGRWVFELTLWVSREALTRGSLLACSLFCFVFVVQFLTVRNKSQKKFLLPTSCLFCRS